MVTAGNCSEHTSDRRKVIACLCEIFKSISKDIGKYMDESKHN